MLNEHHRLRCRVEARSYDIYILTPYTFPRYLHFLLLFIFPIYLNNE